MDKKKKTRAEMMAESYGKNLQELGVISPSSDVHALSDTTTPEQDEKLKIAIAKLRTFLD